MDPKTGNQPGNGRPFKWVGDKANVLIKSVPSLYTSEVRARARPVVDIYHGAYYRFQNIVPDAKVGLDFFELSSVPESGSGYEYQTFLDRLILNCEMALRYIEAAGRLVLIGILNRFLLETGRWCSEDQML
jgi:hypothetical protein